MPIKVPGWFTEETNLAKEPDFLLKRNNPSSVPTHIRCLLSSNNVTVIFKDKFGLMWFGTEDGLNKFDGTNFTIYKHQT
ncbi:MAG: hypothetical protein EOP48_16130, partial [Sphingobacteriales bacterium]